MKKSYLLNALLLVVIVAAAGLFYRYRNIQDPIPPLKERTGPISVTSEWLNTKAAIQGLQRKLREKPNDLKSKLLLAFAYMQEARITGEHPYYYPAALRLIDDILDQEPDDAALLYEATVAKASIQLSLHQFNQALETGQIALAINPNISSVYGVLCDAHVELGNYEEAIAMADRMTAIRPDLKSYSRISYLREIHGDLPGAIEAMEHAAAAGYPGLEQTAWTRVTLGSLYEKTGDLQKAAATYERALAEYPKYAFAVGGLARLAEKKNKPEEAIRLYTEAAAILPEFSFQEELVRLNQLQGETRKAANLTEELIAGLIEDQESGHVMDLELANIYLHLKRDPAKAMTYALKEYKRRPNNIDVCKTLAAIYYKKQDYQRANAFLQKATRTNSQDPTLVCLNGLVKYKLGDRVVGETLIRKSLATDPFQHSAYSTEGKSLLSNSITKL